MKADIDPVSHPAPCFFGQPLGAAVTESGVHYRVWCTSQESLTVEVTDFEGHARSLPMRRNWQGCHEVEDPQGQAGDRYCYRFTDGRAYPDPASRGQETDVRGLSLVINPKAYEWKDAHWLRPAFRDLVIYELHIGTFTQRGSYLAAIERLPYLQELGINAIEIMPLADFPGNRNWGYDGVLLYAPTLAYGHPDDLRALVDAAHGLGIAVIQDVVYNHLGPDGNCLGAFSAEYFNEQRQTPWGASLNWDGPGSEHVREYFLGNATYWMEEFHMDGVRLDATHWIIDTSRQHLIAEIAERVHRRGGYVVAEDERNEARLVEPAERLGYQCDAVWADDYHHSVRVGQTGEKHAYLQDFSGTLEETVETLEHGWLFRGQIPTPSGHTRRGTEIAHVPPSSLIHCISNHDQTGNRAFGERLHAIIPPASYRAISMLLCFTPYTPMLFMGQEWACTSPFMFFTDHHEELGRLVTEGRRKEFVAFPEFNDPARLTEIPDPQAEDTFVRSKLNWLDLDQFAHQAVRMLYQECLKRRLQDNAFRPASREGWQAGILQPGVGYIRFEGSEHEHLLLFHLWPGEEPLEMDLTRLPWSQPQTWEVLISSNEARFGGSGITCSSADKVYLFGEAETLLLRSETASDGQSGTL